MKSRIIALLMVIFISGASLAPSSATNFINIFPEEIVEVMTETCPVMGGKINQSVNTIVDGKLYYFCCAGCIGAFAANPEKFADKLKNATLTTLKVTNPEGKCPVTGENAELKFFTIDRVAKTITFYHNEESKNK
jgi:YHS domain-containing protein